MFYRGGNFPGISRETKYWCFFFIPTMKTAVIEFLLSVNIPTISEMEYVWTKEETFVTLFLLLHNAALLAKKSDCFRYILKGNIYHQMSNCIKSRILNVYGLLSDCLLFFARQKLSKILQFPIFGGGCMKLVSFDQNFIDWHICKSQTHLYLLKDKERLLLIIEWSTLQLLGF